MDQLTLLRKTYLGNVYSDVNTGERVKVIACEDTCMLKYKNRDKKIGYMFFKKFDQEFIKVQS
ncbi:hypothetical protein MA9V1_253 [Chryseobacterium phage MA9V-1]|nr:hypothetical protein MA9V1_253 [Chryseobacterium phage MA9V-1]